MKKIAFVLAAFLFLGILASCGASAAAAPGEVIAPYGIEDRLIGCWVEQKEGDSILQFLPNGRVFIRKTSKSFLDIATWYTAEGQVLTFELPDNSAYFGKVGLLKYTFFDDNTFTMSAGDRTHTFVRTEEHFVDIGY